MPVLLSAALLLSVIVYSVAVSGITWTQQLPFIPGIRSAVADRALIFHSAALFVSLISAVTSFASIFRMRNNEIMVGSKRVLLTLGMLSLCATGVLVYQGKELLWPFLLEIFYRYF